jgi:hypothetical protein
MELRDTTDAGDGETSVDRTSILDTGFAEKLMSLKIKQLKLQKKIEEYKDLSDDVKTRIILSKLIFEIRKDSIKLDSYINVRYYSLLFELKKEIDD